MARDSTFGARMDDAPATAAAREEMHLVQQRQQHRCVQIANCCAWAKKTESWLSIALFFQLTVGIARLLTPRPLVAIANFFLVFLGFDAARAPALVRLFFLCFFSLIIGLSDLFWLVMKFTGPFGGAWLNPEYYWRPLYPSIYDNAYVPAAFAPSGAVTTLSQHGQHSSAAGIVADRAATVKGSPADIATGPPAAPRLVPLAKLFPPEKPPALWRILVELVCLCANPLICSLTAWVAWRLYKRAVLEFQAAEIGFLPSTDEAAAAGYGATVDSPSVHSSYLGGLAVPNSDTTAATANAAAAQALLQPSRGHRAFVPFAGEGRRLGEEIIRTNATVQ